MGKKQSKQRKDADSSTATNNHSSKSNGSASGNSAFQPCAESPQTLETLRDQDEKASGKPICNEPKRMNSLSDLGDLTKVDQDRADTQPDRNAAAVVTDRGQDVIGLVHNDRGVAITVHPDGNNRSTEMPNSQERAGGSTPKMEQEELADQVTETQNGKTETTFPTQVEPNSISVASLSIKEQDPNASGELTLNAGRTDAHSMNGTVNDKIMANQNLKQKIAVKLDQRHSVVKNWEHLATVLDASLDVITTCKINAEQRGAQKLFEFLEATQRHLTVKDFLKKLEDIGRNDVKLIICKTLSGAESSTERLCDVLNSNVQLSDDIALKLDTGSAANKTWLHLAHNLGLCRKQVELIKSGCRNPAAGIMEYVFKKHPNFTVGQFKHHMDEMVRKDVVELLEQCADESNRLEEMMPKDSELFQDVSIRLNQNAGGCVKDWRHFAYRLKIRHDIYDSYDPKKPHSPTETLLDWLVGEYPEFTVHQLCCKVQSIHRNDVYELIVTELQTS